MAAPVPVQSVLGVTGGGIAFPSPNTLGNTIVVYFAYGGGIGPTISDTQGNSYTLYAFANTAYQSGFFIATGIAAGSNTVSISTLGAAGSYGIFEFSGCTGIEASNPTSSGAGFSLSTGTLTTTTPNTLIMLIGQTAASATVTNASGWTQQDSRNTSPSYQLSTFAAGPVSNYANTINATASGAFIQTGMIGLKGSGAGPGGTLLVNPGMDGGMRPQMTGGMSG